MPVEAELKRRGPNGALVPWKLNEDGTDPVADVEVRARIGQRSDVESEGDGSVIAILKRIRSRLGEVWTRLGDGSARTQVTNHPAEYPLPPSQVTDLTGALAREATLQTLRNKDFATQTTLQLVLNRLSDIFSAVDGLEISANNIDISNTTIGLQTDTLESLLQAIRDTLTAEDFASQATLAAVLAAVDGLEGKDFATQATLAGLRSDLQAEDFATQTTLAAILAVLEPKTHKVSPGEASVPTGATFTTVTSVTPTVDTEVIGFNADLTTITDLAYRLRLITGADDAATIRCTEQVDSNTNSFIPLRLSVPANTRIAVQAVHGDLVARTFRATINYTEL
jgi:hypothetical protein